MEEIKEIEINMKEINGTEKPLKIPINYVNVLFYKNKICSAPSGDFIQKIHKSWLIPYSILILKSNDRFGDYKTLEVHHGYIQWLFPNLRKSRFNSIANPLIKEEVELFRKDQEVYSEFPLYIIFYIFYVRLLSI